MLSILFVVFALLGIQIRCNNVLRDICVYTLRYTNNNSVIKIINDSTRAPL